jgi:hypothetical protein
MHGNCQAPAGDGVCEVAAQVTALRRVTRHSTLCRIDEQLQAQKAIAAHTLLRVCLTHG